VSDAPGGGGPGAAEEARSFARRLAALEEGPIRARAASRALVALEPGRAAALLAELSRATRGVARGATVAVAQALADPGQDLPYAWLAEVYAIASDRGLDEVTALLVAPPPHREYEEPRDKADPHLAHLTLGHRKALARAQRDPDLLARLAAEGEPVVVRELLRNPQLTEPFVVRIAARRPCRPETLRCIFEARPWRARPAVALALVRNPYVETEIALKLVAVLATVDLRDVARDGAIHPLVRALAARIVASRATP
jgi:hypothetical protein